MRAAGDRALVECRLTGPIELALLHRRDGTGPLKLWWYEVVNSDLQGSCEHHELPVRDVAKLRFDLREHLPGYVPAETLAHSRERRLGESGGISKTPNCRPDEVFRGTHC